jgi:serine protease Do
MRGVLLFALLLTLPARAQDDVDVAATDAAALGQCARRVAESLAPSIVEVEAIGGLEEEFKAPESEEEAQEGVLTRAGFKQAFGPSTGLVVGADGLIITTSFVLERDPRHIIVTLQDGRAFVARALGRDDARALVLLKIECKDLPVPRVAAPEEVRQGRYAIALGRGLGTPDPAVSLGVVSATDRVGGRAIQSSAAISPANYGGPLAAIDGAVMGLLVPLALDGGMASVDVYDSGIGFAVPMSDVLALVPRLAKGERLQQGFLGIAPDPSSDGGARLATVQPGSPAASAGLRMGDVVTKIGDRAVESAWQLRRALARACAGDELEVEYRRGTETRTVKVRLAAPPAPEAQAPGAEPGGEGDR